MTLGSDYDRDLDLNGLHVTTGKTTFEYGDIKGFCSALEFTAMFPLDTVGDIMIAHLDQDQVVPARPQLNASYGEPSPAMVWSTGGLDTEKSRWT